jgi:hypothetical protein
MSRVNLGRRRSPPIENLSIGGYSNWSLGDQRYRRYQPVVLITLRFPLPVGPSIPDVVARQSISGRAVEQVVNSYSQGLDVGIVRCKRVG